WELDGPDRRARPLHDPPGLPLARARQQERELVAAEACYLVVQPHGPAQHLADRAQHGVPAQVAVALVHRLEVVQVEQDERERLAPTLRARDLLAQAGLEGGMVKAARERIGRRRPLCPLVLE